MRSLYSIIIATKNNSLTIKYVLRSTLLLAQDRNVELVIVDGSSIDNTPNIIRDFANRYSSYFKSVKILRDPGFSLSYARYIGFKNSQGDVLIFLDGDTPLTNTFKHYLELELEDCEVLSPKFIHVPLDDATRIFDEFTKVTDYALQRYGFVYGKHINDPSFLPPARVYKRKVLERIKGYPVSSRFFCEDRITTALAVRLGFSYKLSKLLKLLKIDDPGYRSYWKKHFRYALGIHRDLTTLGKRILRGYVIARRLNHVNVVFPILSIVYVLKSYSYLKSFKKAINIGLLKYFIDTAMLLGDITGFHATIRRDIIKKLKRFSTPNQ